jgi:hypothetical protein
MSLNKWRVTAYGVARSEFTYEVEAATEREALEDAYGLHGRRLRDGAVSEALGVHASAVLLGGGEAEGE